jgi:uncharacterized protein (DUF433 family)
LVVARGIIATVAATMIDLMHRPVYGMAEVDGLCGLTSGTARRWIDGYNRAARSYPPVVRVEPTGSELVTWGEFVETRLLAQFRGKGVPMHHLRPVVDDLRRELNVDYPLAVAQQWLDVAGRELVQRIQDDENLPAGLRLVRIRDGQMALSLEVEAFVATTEIADDDLRSVIRLHPLGTSRAVVMDPLRSAGAPTVRSVPTNVILEQFRTGAAPDEIAESFNLSQHDVFDAIRFELGPSPAAA